MEFLCGSGAPRQDLHPMSFESCWSISVRPERQSPESDVFGNPCVAHRDRNLCKFSRVEGVEESYRRVSCIWLLPLLQFYQVEFMVEGVVTLLGTVSKDSRLPGCGESR